MNDYQERIGYGTVATDQDRFFDFETWRVADDSPTWRSPWARLVNALRRAQMTDLERTISKPFAVDYFDQSPDRY